MLMHKKKGKKQQTNHKTTQHAFFSQQVGYRQSNISSPNVTDVCSNRKVISHTYSQFCAQQSPYARGLINSLRLIGFDYFQPELAVVHALYNSH